VLLTKIRRQSRDVAAWPGQAGDEPCRYWVGGGGKDDRDRPCRLSGGPDQRAAAGHDDVDIDTDQLGCQFGVTLLRPLGITLLDSDVPTFDVPELLQALTECGEVVRRLAPTRQEADSVEPRWLHPSTKRDTAAGQQRESGHGEAGLYELAAARRAH